MAAPPPRKKRFTFESYEQSLKSVHLPSPTAQTVFDEDLPDNFSHFRAHLEQLQQLSLAPSFVKYADHVYGLSESLPLLLHNCKEITDSWIVASRAAGETKDDGEGYKPLLQLLKALAHDLRTVMTPMYSSLIQELLPLLLRKLNPAAFEELLATLLSIFKYILIPSLPSTMLRDTWHYLRRPFVESGNDGRRMLGEVWGAVVRRLSSDQRAKLVSMMLYSLLDEPELRDGIAWVLVAACQSPSRSLHQCTPALLSDCIDVHLAAEDPSETGTVLRRILTSFNHHVAGPVQYQAVADVIVERLQSGISSFESGNSSSEQLKRMFALTEIPCVVRNGSRMKQEQLSTILTALTNLETSTLNTVEGEYASLLLSALVGCEMSVWMGNGRKAVERAWEIESLGLRIAGSLSDVDWDGWTAIMLPSVISHLPVALASDGPNSASALRLLASLHEAGRLKSVPKPWFVRIAEWTKVNLNKWQYSEDQVIQLVHILSLLPILPIAEIELVPSIVRIVNNILKHPPEEVDFYSTPRNITVALAECLVALSRLPSVQREMDVVEYSSWLDVLTLGWSSNPAVMEALLVLSSASPEKAFGSISEEALHVRFDSAIISHDRRLRLSALRMINAHSDIRGESAAPPSVARACLLAEEVALDVAGVRDRVLKIGKVSSIRDDGRDVLLATRWLLAQLKVNLRPLWAPAAVAISSLLDRFPDTVWPLVFDELQRASRQDHAELGNIVPEWASNFKPPEDASDHEAEKSWRCPSAHRLRNVISKWERLPIEAATLYLIQIQRPRDRLDIRNYEIQLLEAMSQAPAPTAKNSRVFVPFFLAIASEQLTRPRLKAYLSLISKFNNPKALYSTSSLHTLHYSFLSSPDRALQLLALDCVMTYKSPALLRHESRLRTVLDEMKWRDELAFLNVQEDVEDGHRKELVEVLIRLLYGIMGDRKGRNRGADRRGAVLGALTPCSSEELETLVQLMLEPFGVKVPFAPLTGDFLFHGVGQASVGQQAGYLNLLGNVLRHLGPLLIKYWPALLSTTLEILNAVQVKINNEQKSNDANSSVALADTNPDVEPINDDMESLDDSATREPHKTSRPLRQIGLRRFADFFKAPVTTFDFAPYMRAAFSSFISPRLANLEHENTQAPSALLELLATWATSPQTAVFLVDYDSRALSKLYHCLNGVNVKATVVSKVLDVIERLLILSSDDERVATTVLRPHNTTLLEQLCLMFERTSRSQLKGDQLAQRHIGILSSLSDYIQEKDQASRLLSLLSPLLRKPAKVVPEKVKTDLLRVTRHLMYLVPECRDPSSTLYQQTYEMLAGLFQTLRGRQARVELVTVFEQLTSADPTLHSLVDVISSLNSFSVKRLDEPDFERRLNAFTLLNESLYHDLSTREWLAVIFNMLYYIQDPEELAVRNNAAFSLRRFVDIVSISKEKESALDWKSREVILTHVLYPALRNGLRSKLELVRAEILGVIAHSVDKCDTIPALQEMRPLLANGDAEASFFNNIHHIQVHRRTRALRRLGEYCRDGRIRSSTISELFVPLVGHFVTSTGVDHHLVNEAIITIGHLAGGLTWSAYNALVQQHLKGAKEKNGQEKIHVRTLVSILDHFHFQLDDVVEDDVEPAGDADDREEPPSATADPSSALTSSMRMKIADAVSQRLLPNLLQFMEKRDEAEDTLRIPISIGIVKVAQHLPEPTRTPQIEKLITVLSQALRSKSQETRDMVRETMCKIAIMLGPQMLHTIIKELRAALLRGPQLHVLAFMAHSILVHVTSPEHVATFGTLDDSVDGVAHIAAEVIFGQSGRDVLSEDFRTKMREVRGSATRGLDTFAIVAKYISPSKISSLLGPVRAIMHETEALKVMQKVDDVLRRVASGLNSNAHLTPAQLLVLCHTFLSQNAKFLRQESGRPAKRKKTDFDVQTKRNETANEDCYANNSHKFVAFGLDLFVTAFRRSLFDFNDRDVISRLEPMVGVIGNTLYSIDAHVVVLGLRAAAAIVRCPLSFISKSLPVYVRQILALIRQAGTTESDVVQNAFKSLATIIRDCPEANVQAQDLAYLLEVLAPDLEEKGRQIAVFALLRAIVSRKFVVPEIYDIMDKVAEIMVTNQSTQVQELCRGVYLQFLLDYPQGKGRLRTQMTFLAKNLSYVFESGRQSVMELLSAIFSKFESKLVYEHSDLFFVALFMVIANDDSAKCRTMAAELIKALFIRLDDPHREIMMDHLRTWASQKSQSSLTRTVAQVYGLLVDASGADVQAHMTFILDVLNGVLETSAAVLRGLELPDDDAESVDVDEIEWQLPYQSLSSLLKIARISTDLVSAPGRIRWDCVIAHSLFPHTWVRLASSRLLGFLFNAFPVGPLNPDLPISHPLSRDGLMDVTSKLCLQLRSPNLDDTLSLQLVKNLFYVGKCFHTWPRIQSTPPEPVEETDEEGDEVDLAAAAKKNDDNAAGNPLPWLFSKLSYQARSAHIARRNRTSTEDSWAHRILSIFRWFAAMANHMPSDDVESFLTHILSPVYRILEDDTIRDPRMDELKTLAQELQTLVQEKMGPTKFSAAYNKIRQSVLSIRRERKSARAIQATSDPVQAARRKMQRNIAKKDSRKRKNQEFTNEKIKQGLKRPRFE